MEKLSNIQSNLASTSFRLYSSVLFLMSNELSTAPNHGWNNRISLPVASYLYLGQVITKQTNIFYDHFHACTLHAYDLPTSHESLQRNYLHWSTLELPFNAKKNSHVTFRTRVCRLTTIACCQKCPLVLSQKTKGFTAKGHERTAQRKEVTFLISKAHEWPFGATSLNIQVKKINEGN